MSDVPVYVDTAASVASYHELMADLAGWADAAGRHPDGLARLSYKPGTLRVVERRPAHCAGGHDLEPPNYTNSWLPCTCAGKENDLGHVVVGCARCGHEWFYPPHTDRAKTDVNWPAARVSVKDMVVEGWMFV